MFANLIYFIIALLIYIVYHPTVETNFPPLETFAIFLCFIIIFASFTWAQFYRLEKQISTDNLPGFEYRFHSTVGKQSVIAILLFAINIYGLSLPSFLIGIPLFLAVPTFKAMLFLGLFAFYLTIVWFFAHRLYQRFYMPGLSRRSYILSNISFSVPALLPWLLLSGTIDIINILPFELPRRILATPEGMMIYLLVFLFGVAIIGPALIQKFWRCKPLETGDNRSRIEDLCKKAGVKCADILYWPMFGGRIITAGVMGLISKFRYILITNTLLSSLEPVEIDAVIAHELGHVRKKHLLFYLLFFAGYMLILYSVFDLILYFIVCAEPIHRFAATVGISQEIMTSTIFSFIIIIIFLTYFRYVFGYFMRNFERQADIHVFTLLGSAEPLISTFKKIAAISGQPSDKPNWHHFNIKERIEYLERCEADRIWITRHDRKIKKGLAVYLVGLLLMAGVGYSLNFGEIGSRLNKHFLKKIIIMELERTPDNPVLYGSLGDLYYTKRDYKRAIRAYERSIALDPYNPRVLNNLAWLYATSDEKEFRDPERAIKLATRAARLKEAPYILDTLAESYYACGRFEEAVSVGMRALELAEEDIPYYEAQLKKFMEAKRQSVEGQNSFPCSKRGNAFLVPMLQRGNAYNSHPPIADIWHEIIAV